MKFILLLVLVSMTSVSLANNSVMRCFKYLDFGLCTQCCSNFLFGAPGSATSQMTKPTRVGSGQEIASTVEPQKECLPNSPPNGANNCFDECMKQFLNEKCKKDAKNKE